MFVWKPANTSPLEQEVANQTYRMGMGDFFTHSVAHAFERTTLGLMAEDTGIRNAEREAGSDDDLGWMVAGLAGTTAVNRNAMPEEDFKAQGFDRNGAIGYTPHTTLQRAKIEADNYDRRQREARLLAQNNDTLLRSAVGFGAGILANLPDPVNLIPVGGALARGASLGRRVVKSAVEGIVGTAVADAVILPEARRRGDATGFADVALDMTFGALIGGGIGGIGGVMHNRRVANLQTDGNSLSHMLAEVGFSEAEAKNFSASTMNVLADMPNRNTLSLAVRQSLSGKDRVNAGKLMDRVMIAMRDGEDIDVGRWARELGADNTFVRSQQAAREREALARSYHEMQRELAARTFGDPYEVLVELRPEGQPGMDVLRGHAIVNAAGEVVVSGREVKAATGTGAGFGLVKILVKHPEITEADILRVPDIIREYESVQPKKTPQEYTGRSWVVERPDGRLLVVGESRLQEDGHNVLATVHLVYIGEERKLSPKRDFTKSPGSVPSPVEETNGERTGSSSPQPAKPEAESGETTGLQKTNVVVIGIAGEMLKGLMEPDFSAPEQAPVIEPPSLDESARLESAAQKRLRGVSQQSFQP